jgi:hypothetical protein
MLDRLAQLLGVSNTVAGFVVLLILVQLGTQVVALVDLARRDAVSGGRKWVWALVIAFAALPGAIAYLAIGRSVPVIDPEDSGSSASGERARRAVDALYGSRDSE